MDHIKKDLKKYGSFKSKLDELTLIKNKIKESTGIEVKSVSIKNNTLNIRANNNYEAVEMRHQSERLKSVLDYKSIKII
jgi:hypothetical protein